jgi:hypothetical protein
LDAIRRVCRIAPGFQTAASPSGTPTQNGPPAHPGDEPPAFTAMAGRFQCDPLPNLGSETYAAELAAARSVGAGPIAVNSPEFITMVRSGPGVVKWAVLMDGSLVVSPAMIGNVEISHPVLSGNQSVRSAGQCTFDIVDGKIVPRTIDLHSGHYMPPRTGSRGRGYLAIGKDAFLILGYLFP